MSSPAPSVTQGTDASLWGASPVLPATPENLRRVELRWVGLHERMNEKLKKISGADRRTEVRLLEQAANSGTAGKRVAWLRKAADMVNAFAEPIAACRRGCNSCCRIAVTISRAEALVISRETGARLNPQAGAVTLDNADAPGAIEALTKRAFGKPCTFLRAGACSIYASRPLACRLLINVDDDALLCQLIENHAPEVPYLNTSQQQAAAVAILGQHQDYDDIRHWFPNGA